MDSISQFVLGAAVTAAVAGPILGPRKALVVGGILGTLPDLDTFYPFDNPIDDFVLHRSATHSLIVHTILAPLLAFLLSRPLRLAFGVATLTIWLVWITHALLDAFTIYGTQLLWPLSAYPYGTGSLFIIDPLYTLPLLLLTPALLWHRLWHSGLTRATVAALIVSTGYMGWSLTAQNIAHNRAQQWLQSQGFGPLEVQTTPTPLNTFFWKSIVIAGDDYLNLYIPLLGSNDDISAYRHPRIDAAGACALALPQTQRLTEFAGGFVKVRSLDDANEISDLRQAAVVSDLRMGVTPGYVFNFAVATPNGEPFDIPIRVEQGETVTDDDWAWLRAGIAGQKRLRQAEAHALMSDNSVAPVRGTSASCSAG